MQIINIIYKRNKFIAIRFCNYNLKIYTTLKKRQGRYYMLMSCILAYFSKEMLRKINLILVTLAKLEYSLVYFRAFLKLLLMMLTYKKWSVIITFTLHYFKLHTKNGRCSISRGREGRERTRAYSSFWR